jgi:hypothetical protein
MQAAARGRSSYAGRIVDRLDHFSVPAREAIARAEAEALRLNHRYIGSEHILLGLVTEDAGISSRVLERMDVDVARVRVAVEFIVGRGDPPTPSPGLGLTPRANRVLDLAAYEAQGLGQELVGTEHVLLGLVTEGEGIAAGVLEALGANTDAVRAAVLAELEEEAPPQTEGAGSVPAPENERIQLLYLDAGNRIRLLNGVRSQDGKVVVETPQFREVLTQSIVFTPDVDNLTTILEFEQLINAPDADEGSFQQFFTAHPEFLLGSEYEALTSEFVLTSTGEETLRPDFLLRPIAGVSWEPAIVELKLPSQPVVKLTPRRPGLYAKIYEGVAQLRMYARFFEEHENREYVRERLGFTAYRPRLVLIVGRSVELADETIRASVFESVRPVEILTYEDILRRHRRRLLTN